MNPNGGGDASLNNTYLYVYEPDPDVYRFLLQDGALPGEYGQFNSGILEWFPRNTGLGALNVVLDTSGSQTWGIVSLNSNGGTQGLILDSQRGLVIVGDFAELFYGWLGKLPYQ